jgi:hypothetical protein
MLHKLLFRRSSWADRLSSIAQTAGDVLRDHGIYCLVGAFRIEDGRANRLLIELRGDLRELDPSFVNGIRALLVHGLNKHLQLELTGASVVLAISGEDVAQLPSLKAASANVLHRAMAPGKGSAQPAGQLPTANMQESAVQITEFGESGWTLFAHTVAVTPASSSRFGAL